MNVNSEIANSVYKVVTAAGSGTSFYLKEEGVWVTNYHVVAGNRSVTLENHNRDRFLAEVVLINPEADLAFLKSDHDVALAPHFSYAEGTAIRASDPVYVLGFPFGMPYTVTEGIVSAPKQLMEGKHYIQTDAAVNPGNSGGPVITAEGKLVGVTTAKFQHADNMGFAIPIDTLLSELESVGSHHCETMAVICHSCGGVIDEPTEYCPNCGADVNQNYFQEFPLSDFALFIEESIEGLGINPILARAGEEFWEFHQGSSQIRIFAYNQRYIYATSPLNVLPKQNLEPLYRYILGNKVEPYKFGIHDNQIFISYRVAISDIYGSRREEIRDNITHLALKADEMDDYFVNEFGCDMTNFSKLS